MHRCPLDTVVTVLTHCRNNENPVEIALNRKPPSKSATSRPASARPASRPVSKSAPRSAAAKPAARSAAPVPSPTLYVGNLAWATDRSEGPAGNNSIEVYIHRLRRKLEGSGLQIRTVRGLGYLLEAE